MKMKIVAVAGLLAGSLAWAAWGVEKTNNGVPPGYRGIGIPVSESEIPFVKKGDRIDVLVTFDAMLKDGKEKVTATILQNVLVMEVKKPQAAGEKGAVELVVNPNEAQYLALGLKQGDLQIIMRPEGDVAMKPMEMASFRKLFK